MDTTVLHGIIDQGDSMTAKHGCFGIFNLSSLNRSLKWKLNSILILSACIPLVLIGLTSFFSIVSIQKNKIATGIHSSLKQTRLGIENTFNNLNYASKQLVLDGKIGEDLDKYISTDNAYDKIRLKAEIEKSLRIINFSNHDLGLMFYYLPEEKTKVQFENLEVQKDFDIKSLPLITNKNGVSFYGPHRTAYRYGNNIVLSMVREAYIPGKKNVFVYMETNYKIVKAHLNTQKYGMAVCHFLLDANGDIAFVEENQDFGGRDIFRDFIRSWPKPSGKSDLLLFKEMSEMGWSIGAAIKKQDFNREIDKWMLQFGIITLLTLLISAFFGVSFYRRIYNPIKILSGQIKLVGNSKFDSPLSLTKVQEFDSLLTEFDGMRVKIQRLLDEVEQKERSKRNLEAERLLYQINPHFLCNSLDTVRWMARLNGQTEIDKTVSSLNRLLHYNLRINGELTTVKEEVDVLEDYVAVEKSRYDFEFEKIIDSSVLGISIPRFILQPVVENALKHGVKDSGKITLTIKREGESHILIEIADNGCGISEEARQAILSENDICENRRIGLGLRYIRNKLNIYYDDTAVFDIRNVEPSGTAIILKLPVGYEEGLKP